MTRLRVFLVGLALAASVTAQAQHGLLLLGVGAPPAVGGGGFALIAGGNVANNLAGGGGDSSTFNSTGGNLIVVAVGAFNSDVVAGDITDNKSNTNWQLAGVLHNSFTARVYLFYHVAPNVGSGHVVTLTSDATFGSIAVATFSGADGSAPFDDEDGDAAASVSSISPASGITPSAADSLVVSALAGYAAEGTITDPSGYTRTNSAAADASHVGITLAYKIQVGAASAEDPSWTTANTVDLAVTVVSFVQ